MLHYVYGIEVVVIAVLLGTSVRSIHRWTHQFKTRGHVGDNRNKTKRRAPWPQHVIDFTDTYVKEHPCFYVEELQETLNERFPEVTKISPATI